MGIFSAAYLIVEIIAFILLGMWLGFGWALLLVFALFVAGMIVSAWQIRSLAQRAASQKDNPGKITADAALSVVGSLGVALPGVVSSIFGLLLLLPPTRALTRKLIGSAARRGLERIGGSAFTTATAYGAPQARNHIPGWGEVIDHRDDEFKQ